MEKEIITEFCKKYILKNRYEKAINLLLNNKKRGKFTDRLNHKIEDTFKINLLSVIDSESNISLPKNSNYYIISNDNLDGSIKKFDEAFEILNASGFGFILINTDNLSFILKEEQTNSGTRIWEVKN